MLKCHFCKIVIAYNRKKIKDDVNVDVLVSLTQVPIYTKNNGWYAVYLTRSRLKSKPLSDLVPPICKRKIQGVRSSGNVYEKFDNLFTFIYNVYIACFSTIK